MPESREAADQDLGPVVFPFKDEEQKIIRQAAKKVNAWMQDGGEVPRVSISLLGVVAIFVVDESQAALAQPESNGRFNSGDETGGAVKRFGFDCSGARPEIIPATNGAFVWYSDYLKLFNQAAQPVQESAAYWKLAYERTKALLEIAERRADSRELTAALESEPVNRRLLEALRPFAVYGRPGSRDVEVGAAIAAIAEAEAAQPMGREPLTAETVESMRQVWFGFPAGRLSVFTSFMRWAKRVLGITREGM